MSESSLLVVGLGNPGIDYQDSRHNAGFWLLNSLSSLLKADFKQEKYFNASLAKIKVYGNSIFLLKPTTYMNNSGLAVSTTANFYKIPTENILVFHDDMDIPPGDIRIKFGGGNAGHNGLKSIQNLIGKSFWRIRIGIGHPRLYINAQSVSSFVLGVPDDTDMQLINNAMKRCLNAVHEISSGSFSDIHKLLKTK